jgi:hypothetical protein
MALERKEEPEQYFAKTTLSVWSIEIRLSSWLCWADAQTPGLGGAAPPCWQRDLTAHYAHHLLFMANDKS